MIFATVGTHKQGFERMVQAFDLLARAQTADEELIIQYGTSGYIPQHATAFQWATSQKMDELTRSARILVTHAAAGAIILGLRAHKPLIVIPRLKQFAEHMDDHQIQLAQALDHKGQAIAVTDPSPETLAHGIARAGNLSVKDTPVPTVTAPDTLMQALRQQMTLLKK